MLQKTAIVYSFLSEKSAGEVKHGSCTSGLACG